MNDNISENKSNIINRGFERISLFKKKISNRIPDGLKEFFRKNIFPYTAILVVTCFVFTANLAHAVEDIDMTSNDEIMDLNPLEVANVVGQINPYTPNYEEDSVQVALAMKNQDYLGKPVITETAQTKAPEEDRKTTITYTIEGGDTLSTIGWQYGLKIATIKAINGLTSDTIKPGQKLKLPPQDLSPSYIAQLTAQKRKVAGASYNSSSGSGSFGRPTAGWSISQYFGRTNFERYHTGIDLDSRSGRTIFASESGRVVAVRRGWGSGYGNHIIIDHGGGFITLYGHLASFSVYSRQYVNRGRAIGVMGSTGWSTGVHLHFEIRKNGIPRNPLGYL